MTPEERAENDPTYWETRLAGKSMTPAVNVPEYGFYRKPTADKLSWVAVAYWRKGGFLHCHVNFSRITDEVTILETWQRCCDHPITHEVYEAVKKGGEWPDIQPTVLRQRMEMSNRPPEDDTFESLRDLIDELVRDCERMLKRGAVDSDEISDRAGNMAKWLNQLWNRADKAREREKAPYLAAERAVDDKWRPLLQAAKIYERMKAFVQPWLAKKEAEKRRKEQAALEEAMRAQQEAMAKEAAEAAARAKMAEAEAAGDHEAAEAAAEQVRAAEHEAIQAETRADAAGQALRDAEETKVKAGSRGGGVHLRTVRDFEYTDRDAALAFFKNEDEIQKALDKLVRGAVKAKVPVPGVKVVISHKAA